METHNARSRIIKKIILLIGVGILIVFSLLIFVNSTPKENIIQDLGIAETNLKNYSFSHPRYTKETMGHKAWEILHLISAFVPENYSSIEKSELELLLRLLYIEY